MQKLSAKWVPKCLNADHKCQWCHSSEQILENFRRDQMTSCRDWWPWKKLGYIIMIRCKSNNQWSAGIAGHAAPKIPSLKIRWKSSRLVFLGSRLHTPHWLYFKWPNYQRGVLLISADAIEGHLKEKRRGQLTNVVESCSCTTMPRITGHLQLRRNWPSWASSVLITHPILRICPRRTNTCSPGLKKELKVRHFSSHAEVVAAAETWLDRQHSEFFLSGMKS
jgi:hypothetical protein